LIKEGKQAVKMTRLSWHRFRSDQVLTLYLWGRLALPTNREPVSLQQRLVRRADGW
jgi:hypothetical protein